MNKLLTIIFAGFFLITSGCATTDGINEQDPYESFNRKTYAFNSAVDKAVLKPVAQGYDAVTPEPLKRGVSNFFSNLGEITNILNNLLQGKFTDAFADTSRFVINTTLGVAGFIDVATDLGIEESDEDFGQTLGAWGVDSGSYLVLPFLGPSSFRDVLGRPVDSLVSIEKEIDHIPTRNTIYFMDIVDLRYRLLAIDGQLEDALDEYTFVRDAYLMRRNYLVHDGNPPEEDDFYEDECEFEEDCEDDEIID